VKGVLVKISLSPQLKIQMIYVLLVIPLVDSGFSNAGCVHVRSCESMQQAKPQDAPCGQSKLNHLSDFLLASVEGSKIEFSPGMQGSRAMAAERRVGSMLASTEEDKRTRWPFRKFELARWTNASM